MKLVLCPDVGLPCLQGGRRSGAACHTYYVEKDEAAVQILRRGNADAAAPRI